MISNSVNEANALLSRNDSAKDADAHPRDTNDVANRRTSNSSPITLFSKMSEVELKDSKRSQTMKHRLWRCAMRFLGLSNNLNQNAYFSMLKRVHGNVAYVAGYAFSHPWKWTTKVLHSDKNPLDIYYAVKNSSSRSIFSLIILYFLVCSAFFGAISVAYDCYETSSADFLPKSFMLISGLGYGLQRTDNLTACFWIESFALLVGVYVSLPAFGAILLVRLLDNRAHQIAISSKMLLTKREGEPLVMLRMANKTGMCYYNFNVKLIFGVSRCDVETKEKYIKFVEVPDVKHMYEISGFPQNISINVSQSSILRQENIVLVNEETGIPKWNRASIVSCRVWAQADAEQGGRTSISSHAVSGNEFIDANDDGQLPQFESCVQASIFDWVASQGEMSPTIDFSRLSSFKYVDTPWSLKLKAQRDEEEMAKALSLPQAQDKFVSKIEANANVLAKASEEGNVSMLGSLSALAKDHKQ